MRLRGEGALPVNKNDEEIIRKVLKADRFEIFYIKFESDTVKIGVNNTKFRSQAQAVGRVASTLQRFTSDAITSANISFYSQDLLMVSFRVELEKVTTEQFDPFKKNENKPSIRVANIKPEIKFYDKQRFTYGAGPYVTHRLFNPDLPFSMETGLEVAADYRLAQGLMIASSIRKSLLTNLTKNNRRSNSVLPRVHSDWPLYDIAGQSGHIHELTLSYVKNLGPGLYGRTHAGLLEPFFAGVGAEILYKPAQWPVGIGVMSTACAKETMT